MLKATAIISDTTLRCAVDQEDLKPCWKSEKRSHFSKWSTIPLSTSFSKTLLTTERRLTGWLLLAADLSQIFLNTRTTGETFKHFFDDSFKHLLKSSASVGEKSGSQFFRTTTGIQSGSDAFDKSRFVMTFLTILEVTEIVCSFRLVLEGETGEEIPESSWLKFVETFSGDNLLYQMQTKTARPLNRGGITDLPLLRKDTFRNCYSVTGEVIYFSFIYSLP